MSAHSTRRRSISAVSLVLLELYSFQLGVVGLVGVMVRVRVTFA